MPIPLPDITLPAELTESGPGNDPEILLTGLVNIGPAPYRIFALRIDASTLEVDYREDVDEDDYEEYELGDMLEDLTARDDLDASNLVPMNGATYVVWMMPYLDAEEDRHSARCVGVRVCVAGAPYQPYPSHEHLVIDSTTSPPSIKNFARLGRAA